MKYGITLNNSLGGTDYISDKAIIWDASYKSQYHHDVIGIGIDNYSKLEQKQSHQADDSTKIYISNLAVSNAANTGTFSQRRQFVVMGHNTNALSSRGSTEFPSGQGIYSRIEREWKITHSNFTDSYSLDIKLNAGTLNASDLRVLIDDDGDFTNATIMSNVSISVSGTTVTISGISITEILKTQFLTIASVNSDTPLIPNPLPITLLNFNANITDTKDKVSLTWQTAQELNNDFFTIERSNNATDWESLLNVDGAGNSSKLLSYQSIDGFPYDGVSYYRLKQTDFDGKFVYSKTVSVNREAQGNSRVEIFPNPAKDKVTITGSPDEIEYVRIYNALGQDITKNIEQQTGSDKSKLTIDLSSLDKGFYFIKTKTTAHKLYKQ